MIVCQRCGEILHREMIDKILADREAAIKRMNERNLNGYKEKRNKEKTSS